MPAVPTVPAATATLGAHGAPYMNRAGGVSFFGVVATMIVRAVTDPGVFYGAESVRTAGVALGYWRWKFLQDAVDLARIEPVAHTAFRADIATPVVDLQRPPFDADAAIWLYPTDYGPTQQFARVAREAHMGGILYRSVRDPQPSWCLALLTPTGFAKPKPHAERQTWYLAVSRHEVTLRRDTESMQFSAAGW